MPRVRPLTPELRQQERDRRSNEILARALRRHRVDTRMTDYDLAVKLGVGRSSIWRWKEDPGKMALEMARRLDHECKLTPEEWLAIGGFQERGKPT